MKLAEALLLRGDMQKKLASLKERIARNALAQEGSPAHENSNEMLLEAFGVVDELSVLLRRINMTNMNSKLPDGRSLTEALALRDALEDKHKLLTATVDATHKEPERYSMREVKWVAQVDISKLQKQRDDFARQARELNAKIQEANWKIELAE